MHAHTCAMSQGTTHQPLPCGHAYPLLRTCSCSTLFPQAPQHTALPCKSCVLTTYKHSLSAACSHLLLQQSSTKSFCNNFVPETLTAAYDFYRTNMQAITPTAECTCSVSKRFACRPLRCSGALPILHTCFCNTLCTSSTIKPYLPHGSVTTVHPALVLLMHACTSSMSQETVCQPLTCSRALPILQT